MTKKTIELAAPLEHKDFLNMIDFSVDNQVIEKTEMGEWKDQIVPALYIRQNKDFRIDFNSASSGYHLRAISTESHVTLYIEFLNTIFIQYYNPSENYYSILKHIDRSLLTKFKQNGKTQFMGVKAKNSFKIMSGMRGAPVGGLIAGAIFRGAFKLAAKVEDDLVEKEGYNFSLFFLENNTEKSIDVIVESFYAEQFHEFLKLNWNSKVPKKPIKETKKTNEGCFIATACYNDYDHPIVLHLRTFRDVYLSDKKWGRTFISFYYHHSPKYAQLISKNKFLKCFIKVFLIKPLYFLTKFLNLKNEKNSIFKYVNFDFSFLFRF